MIFSPQTAEAANSLLGAFYLTQAAGFEKTALTEERMIAPLFQAFQGRQAFYFANQLLSQVGRAPLSSSWKWGVQLLPPLMALLSSKLPEGRIQKIANSLHENTGAVFRVTSLVSQVALVYFTGSTVALVGIAYLTIDLLDGNGLLSPLLSKVYSSIKAPLFLTSQFFSAGNWVNAFAWGTSTMVWTTVEYLVPLLVGKARERLSRPPAQESLTPEILRDIRLSGGPDQFLRSRFSYLKENALPVRPMINFEQALLKQIPWKDDADLLQGHSAADLEKALADRLAELKKDGLPIRIYKLRVIASHLSSKSVEGRAKFLVKLATAEKPVDVINEEFDRIVSENQDLRTLILQELQIVRTGEVFYAKPKAPDAQHNFALANAEIAFSRNLGSPSTYAHLLGLLQWNSDTLYRPPMLFSEKDIADILRHTDCYFPTDLVKIVRGIPNFNQAATAWWKAFVKRQPPESQREFLQIIESIQGGANIGLAGLDAIAKLRMTDTLVLAMLFEMGILELIPREIEK